nr:MULTISPECIES: hypothetical protein [unclassified Rhizobium]
MLDTLATSSSLYDTLAIDPAMRDELETRASLIFDLGRRTTEQTFELGDHLAAAAEMLTDGNFDGWVKKRCGLAVRSARNYVAVYRNLTPYRDDLVDLSVGSTALFHLSSATPEQITEAIAFATEHGRLQVSDVKSILAGGDQGAGKATADDHFSAGGVTGLKALIALKVRDGLKAFIAHIETICQMVGTALARKRVIKEALAKEIVDLARIARQELESLALFVEPEIVTGPTSRATTFPKTSEWARVSDTLLTLGSIEAWPKSGEMRGWLENQVLPILVWAISKERKPAAPAGNVTDPASIDVIAHDGAAARAQLAAVPPLAPEELAERSLNMSPAPAPMA